MTPSTVSSLLIRPCEEADIPAITEIYRDAVLHGRASFEIDPPTAETMAERRRLLVEGNYPYLVAEVGAQLWQHLKDPFYDRGPNDKGIGIQLLRE